MDKKTVEEMEVRFGEVMQTPPYPVDEILELIGAVPPGKAEEWTLAAMKALTDAGDFDGTRRLVKARKEMLGAKLQGAGIRDVLRKATKDRLLLAFIDSVGFGVRSLDEAFARLERLLAFQPGRLVLNQTWGLGEVKRIDSFYRRITVDFTARKGHQMTFDAACETLVFAPEDHILVTNRADPARVQKMLKEEPGEFVKAMLKSFGDMPVTRLEELCAQHGFVKLANWKTFWEKARAELRRDRGVTIPARRAEPICLKASTEEFAAGWAAELSAMTDPKAILAAVRSCASQGKIKDATAEDRAGIEDRLVFAATASRKVDDALYARIACAVKEFGFARPTLEEMRAYLWERRRFVKAAETLPAREVGAMVAFLACDEECRARLYQAIPDLCFAAVAEIVSQFGGDEACRRTVGDAMKQPKAPATLTTLLVGKYEQFREWAELPPLVTLLSHAIALGEGRQSGETLKMQNIVRRLFCDKTWLEKVFGWLPADHKAMFFERFQASIAWDPSTHHAIVVRMMRIVPELESHFVKVEKKRELPRETSYRSYGLRKAEYLKLINEDMPANVKRIEFAKSYGDLSENAEYQYAKDEQRALMQKQSRMQADLEAVKPSEFADATTDAVMPGVTVVVETKDGERTWTVLGEWDNDIDMGIMSSKARVAQNMMGRRVGDNFELPDAEGNLTFATIKEIRPLSDEVRAWMKLPPGIEI